MRFCTLTSVIALLSAAPALAEPAFNRIASFATPANMAAGEDTARKSSAEIITVTEDGMTAIYSDSPLKSVGMIDLTDPHAPKPLGNISMGGEPTTTVVIGERAFVGVNTSESFTNPSGKLVTLDIATRAVLAECDLGGQPDAVARARDGSFVAVAIENERDEDANGGALPQMPAGYVVKIPVANGAADCAALSRIELTSLADVSPEDPEPEYLDVNDAGEIVVTLQENNHIVVIGADDSILSHFSAGAVDLTGIDTKSEGALRFDQNQVGRLREPDTVQWIDANHFATANEGDYKGGSRGWTIFHKDGTVVYENGTGLERAIIEIGHYPEKRSKSKGNEPEGMEFARFGDTPLLFVASERASIVGVYDLTDPARPALKQLLPSGVGPEGLIAIPERNLLITANETDLRGDGLAPAHVMVFERGDAPAIYPTITSAGSDRLIGWGALSGLTADPEQPGRLYAVSDSVYGMAPTILAIDATQTPARITTALPVTRAGMPAQKLDLEGIAADGKGGFWLASEGRSDRLIPHAIYHVDAKGEITQEIALPPELLAHETRFGFEGVAVQGDVLWLAVQREWRDDPKGMTKLVAYNTADKSWGAVRYPLDTPAEGTWMGLSEITIHGDWAYIIERDNQIADKAQVKQLTRVALSSLAPAPLAGDLPVVTKEVVRDFLPDLKAQNGYVVDKVEGFAIDATGTGYVVTDNDGVDDSSGETLFWSVGALN